MELLRISKKDKILIVAPHPDDECIGPGGILCMYPAQCSIIVLTDGGQGQGRFSTTEYRIIRKDEFIKEMEELSVTNYKMLEIPDGSLMQHTDCLYNMDLSMYSKIFVTGERDGHSDHTAAFLSVVGAVKKQNLYHIDIYIYEVHNQIEQPTHLLDITQCIDKKLKLIDIHKSQLEQIPYDRYAQINAEYRALQNRMTDAYVEVYASVNISKEQDMYILEIEKKLQKFYQFYQLLTCWMMKKAKEESIALFLKNQGINTVIIYGYSELGKILRQEIEKTIEIRYIFDKKIRYKSDGDILFCFPEKKEEKVDLVIVTAIYDFEIIKEELEALEYMNVVSLKDLVDKI